MFSRRKKYKVTDPCYYDQLISDQKKQVNRLNDKVRRIKWEDYAQFLDKRLADFGINIENQFLDKLEIITNQYRNAIAHRSPMDKKQYEDLRKLDFVENESLITHFNKKRN